jgi:hypothetical protein
MDGVATDTIIYDALNVGATVPSVVVASAHFCKIALFNARENGWVHRYACVTADVAFNVVVVELCE